MPKALRKALREEIARLRAEPDLEGRIKGVGDLYAALDVELEALASVRHEAIVALSSDGLSYAEIARRTGLSKARVARLGRASSG